MSPFTKTRRLSRDRSIGRDRYRDSGGGTRPYVLPWSIWACMPVAALLFRSFSTASNTAAVIVGAVAAAVAVGLSAFTWHVFTPRGASLRTHATASIAAAGVWVLWSTAAGLFQPSTWVWFHPIDWFLGLFNGWVWGAWLLLGPVLAITWNLRRGARGDGNDTHRNDGGLLEKVGIAGTVKRVELEAGGTRVKARVAVEPGEQTAADVQSAKGRIASALQVRESAVRVNRVPGNFAEADVIVVPRDQLQTPIAWPGPLAPGESIAVEIPVGRYEDAETARLWLPGDRHAKPAPRNATHYALMGASGSGKSEGALTLCTEVITRADASVIYSDPVKGIQTVAPIAAGIDLLLTDPKTAVAAYRRLTHVIAARTHHLGRHGFKQWEPAAAMEPCGLKYLLYIWEEAAALLANSGLFVQITEQARSAGISLIPSMQRMSHDRMDTSARYNLGGGWCFGTGDDISAKFALSEQTLDAGAAPWEWKDRKPGYSYLEAAGVPEDRWAIPLRTYLGDPDQQREAVAEFGKPGLDPVTAEAFGKVYLDYRQQVTEGAAAWQSPTPTRITMAGAGLPNHAAVDEDDDPDGVDADSFEDPELFDPDGDAEGDDLDGPDFEVPEHPEPGFGDDIDPSKDISDPGDDDGVIRLLDPPPARPGMSTSAARAALRRYLTDLAAAGHETVEPKDLVEFRQQIGRGKSWLSDELRRLVDDGLLTDEPDRGVYGLPALAPGERTLVPA
ncbi:hypothetical protein ACFO1B_30880 [Dactylosporangium siamense]|uniref:Sporulation protein SsgA n=1 Tax=Dactylosporangium siamense TaxID=685454 RepID=A0A919UEZ4_9ACTN|nr:hypothetical protein [Dactylosporangium siamense]GIG48118.1 sporulation protein SsgA [Dactylosporangium siamense]